MQRQSLVGTCGEEGKGLATCGITCMSRDQYRLITV